MTTIRGDNCAFGAPGLNPTWAHGDKDGVGTAYSTASRLWYTIWKGIVTEVYFPTADKPQTRDVQYLFSDGTSLLEEEVKMDTSIERIGSSLGYRVVGRSEKGGYEYEKQIISDPHSACLLQHTTVTRANENQQDLRLYVLCAPHLNVGGAGNNAKVLRYGSRHVMVAHRDGIWLAMMATVPFSKASVGYVGRSDGWTDLHTNGRMEWEFDCACDGNVALMGEIDVSRGREFTLGVAFGESLHRALATLAQSLAIPFSDQLARFVEQWDRTPGDRESLESQALDGGRTYRTSVKLLLAHEDKLYPGAMVASLAIPWGQAKDDEQGKGGYHLIWTRDMVQSAMGLLAAGQTDTPLRSLIYLTISQKEDGGFAQNFWVEGDAFWTGTQLDETAFPVMLAHRLWKENALLNFDPLTMVQRAAGFLIREGPVTMEERWEEASGYSPSTLAVLISAMVCAADFTRAAGDEQSAVFLEQYADWLEENVETWTVTEDGTLLEGVPKYYVRINPSRSGQAQPDQGVGESLLELTSQPPGASNKFLAKNIVDAGFLELVRYGIRSADDPTIVDSLKVVDAYLKAETPSGTAWRRYNHDGYGQRDDGGPYIDYGTGRAWPLLTGERGHYEIAAGRAPKNYIQWMETLGTPTYLLPEQSWDAPDTADGRLQFGRPTGSAVPLLWAHSEYIRLLRSAKDGKVFDMIPEVAGRYLNGHRRESSTKFWSFNCPAERVATTGTLRILTRASCDVQYSADQWQSAQHCSTSETPFGVFYADVPIPESPGCTIAFTFFWHEAQTWENRSYSVSIV